MNTTLRKIGNSEGVIIPKDVLARLGLKPGDSLSIVETTDGLRLLKSDPDFDAQLKIARERMQKYRVALAELAK